jgi:hypothetical protein
MRAAGSRPAIPALARMLENSTHHACETGEQTALADPRSPQSIILSSIIDGTGRRSHDHSGRQPGANRHKARCSWMLSLPRLRALQVADAGRRRVWLWSPTAGIRKPSHERGVLHTSCAGPQCPTQETASLRRPRCPPTSCRLCHPRPPASICLGRYIPTPKRPWEQRLKPKRS